MKYPFKFCLFAIGFLLLSLPVFAVEESEAAMFIVIPDKVLQMQDSNGRIRMTQMDAAKRMQFLIEKATGELLPIYHASEAPKEGSVIYVGYGDHLVDRVDLPVEPEGYTVISSEDDLILVGTIAPAGTNNRAAPADLGLMHAVEAYAQEVMGYRFLLSSIEMDPDMFELGTVIPRMDLFSIPSDVHLQGHPVFAHRVPHGLPRGFMGLKTGSSRDFNINHVHDVPKWKRLYAKEHPELFVLNEDGTRNLEFLDYAEPLVLEKELEHLEKYFQSNGEINIGMLRPPNTQYIFAEPSDHYKDSYSEAALALREPDEGWGKQSNLWFDYIRRLSTEVKRRWPSMRIATLAYQWHYYPPDMDIPDNVDIMLCLMRSSTQNKQPEVFEYNLEQVKEWYKLVGNDKDRLFLWEYWCWPGLFVTPSTIAPHSMQKWLKEVEPYVSGVFINGEGYIQQDQYLAYYLWLRLLWNPEMDVDAEIADATEKFFGPAGESMNQFYTELIDGYELEWQNANLIWGQYYAHPDLYYAQSYPEKRIKKMASLLEYARQEVGLPPEIESEVRTGSAFYVPNIGEESAPLELSLKATESPIVNPAVIWSEGEVTWEGVVQPGQRLVFANDGGATLISENGLRSSVEAQGQLPAIPAGAAQVFHFRSKPDGKDATFDAKLTYGKEPEAANENSPKSVFARRLEWLRTPYFVFQPTVSNYALKQGLFVEATVAQENLGKVPSYEVSEVEILPEVIDDPIWQKASGVSSLVQGRASGGTPYLNYGFPADRETTFEAVFNKEGIALLLHGEGEPLEDEVVTVRVFDSDFVLYPGNPEGNAPYVRHIQSAGDLWSALLVFEWSALREDEKAVFYKDIVKETGAQQRTIPVQIERTRSKHSVYVWSPPLSSPWGDEPQGPGEFIVRPSGKSEE